MSHPRFSIIPAGAVTDRTLEPRDLQVLCLLGRHTDKAGWCVRSQVKMAQELDCSRGSLQNSLDRLCAAGWMEKKRRDVEVEEAGKQPSRSYAYRVLLDRDDYSFQNTVEERDDEDAASYAENASEGEGCQQAGTPDVPAEQHPGANPYVGTPANTYDGTKNVPLERPPLERERDARAREKAARFLAAFETRWPTSASDDRQRVAYAAAALADGEHDAALAGIGPFLENHKRIGRKHVPAGWKYLEEKRWELLDQKSEQVSTGSYARDSVEGRALLSLHDIGGVGEFFRHVNRKLDGMLSYRAPVDDRLRALALAPKPDAWVTLNRQQAAAWEAFLREHITANRQRKLAEGSRAPWPWPPKLDGSLYTSSTGPPDSLMTEDDHDFEFK